jgi:adenylosuccinate synthase
MMLEKGKLNVGPLDAAHGSSGKGKIADYIASVEDIDFAISHNSYNASHVTVFDDGREYKFNFLPSSVSREGIDVVIGADAVIEENKALKEIADWNLTPERLFMHPLVTIIEQDDIDWEIKNLASVGSTMTGGGAAKAKKITRTKKFFAKDHPQLKKFVKNTHELVNNWLAQGRTGLLETAQGYDLSQDVIWTAPDGEVKAMYPYNTSRNINTASYLGFSFVPPQLIGNTILNLRTYPIRVGDASTTKADFVIKLEGGAEKGLYYSEFGTDGVPTLEQVKTKYPKALAIISLGSSGPVYDDQKEISWEEVTKRSGSPIPIKETTSLTQRTRRVFDRSLFQLRNATMACMPQVVSVNFVNYLDYSIAGQSGRMTKEELRANWPKVAEYVDWVEANQFWQGERGGEVRMLGTGPKRSEIIIITG